MNRKKIYIIIIFIVTLAFWQTLLPNVHVINNFKKSYNIFFTETNSKRNYFSPRQICAIESAALNNPSAKINVYADSAKLHQKWLDKYQNIKIIKLDYDDLFKETFFENWFKINKQIIYNSIIYYLYIICNICIFTIIIIVNIHMFNYLTW